MNEKFFISKSIKALIVLKDYRKNKYKYRNDYSIFSYLNLNFLYIVY